jgi:hypothetical protein
MRYRYTDDNGDDYVLLIWDLDEEKQKKFNSLRRYSMYHTYTRDDGKLGTDNWMWSDGDLENILNSKYLNDEIKNFISKVTKLVMFS